MNDTIKIISLSSLVCSIFITGNYLHAQWSNPTNNPPTANIAAPINTSGSHQFKAAGGRIGADQLVGFERVRADEYCDLSGENCSTAGAGELSIELGIVWTETHGRTATADRRCRIEGWDGFWAGMDNDSGWENIICYRATGIGFDRSALDAQWSI